MIVLKYECLIQTPLGEMIALAGQDALYELRFAGQKYAPENNGDWVNAPDHRLFKSLRQQLEAYFAGQLTEFDLPLAPAGTPFRMAVWELLRGIPSGTTVTYGSLADQLAGVRGGVRPAAQAVGGAVGHNPIAIIIPCHRVVGSNGSLTGYAGGIERKAALLELENGDNSAAFR